MPDVWKHWAGQIIDAKFPLQAYLGGSDYSAVFLTERPTGRGPEKAAIKLIPGDPQTSERQLARWRLAAGLSHPHLVPIYEMAQSKTGGIALLYVVMEYAEENLADVLTQRALTPAEARAMLEQVLDALGYLHGKNLVHGHIKPSNLMANGDRLMISSDGVRPAGQPCDAPGRPDAYDAPETARGVIPGTAATAPASDMWSLGVTLVEALTQKLPGEQPAAKGELLLPAGLPEPMLDIARHTVTRHPQSRWTAAEIAARLEGRTPARGAAAAGTTLPAGPAPKSAAAPSRGPVRPTAQAPARQAGRGAGNAQRRQSKRYLYALVAVAGVVLGAWGVPKLWRQQRTPQASVAAANTNVPQASQPAASKAPAAAHSAQAAGHRAKATAEKVAPAKSRTDPGGVAQRVLPPIPQSASDTVHGKVRVNVRVDVDATGKVTHAALDLPGPSKYFARKSMEAAPEWTFAPPRVNGRRVPSQWLIEFGYTNGGPEASAKQTMP